MSFEIEIADKVEEMLRNRVFRDERYLIRRDGRLIPKGRGVERREQHLYVHTNQTYKARDIEHVDSIVLDSKEPKTIEMILEYEYNTNPKNMIGNFLTPFMIDQYEANYSNDNNVYKLDSKKTLVFLLICFEKKHDEGDRGQAPLQKGKNVRTWLLRAKELLLSSSNILDGNVLITDDIVEGIEKLYSSISKLRPELISAD